MSASNPYLLNTIYSSYEWLSERVDRALMTELGNSTRLREVQELCTNFRTSVEQVRPLFCLVTISIDLFTVAACTYHSSR